MKTKLKKGLVGVSIATILLGANIGFSEPGSNNDPLVSMSYVKSQMDELKNYINDKIDNNSSSTDFKVVEVSKGKRIIGGSGTEIILRGGKATPYNVKEDKGLANVTEGVDIDNENTLISANHLIIVPRSDGRGIYAESKAIFMVKGDYKIE